jgi:putative oxidoreductase
MDGRRQASKRTDLALLLLRLVFGGIFVAHGWQKLFIFGIAGVTGVFAKMGVPLPQVTGPFIGVVELAAGVALIIGLLTRLAALGLTCDMLGAIILVVGKKGFFLPSGCEFELALLGAVVALAIAGAGAYSIDAVQAGRRADAAVQPTSPRFR